MRLRHDHEDPECESCGRNGDTFACVAPGCQNAAHRGCSPRCIVCGRQVCAAHTSRLGEEGEPHCPACVILAFAEESEAYLEAVAV